MKYHFRAILVFLAVCLIPGLSIAQKAIPKTSSKRGVSKDKVIFAVLNDGKTLEPIAVVNGGKLDVVNAGDGDENKLREFDAKNYKPGTAYEVIFGGSSSGNIIIKSSGLTTECGKGTAAASLSPANVSVKGLIMPLATNIKLTSSESGFRRRPTADERTEIEKLVRAELKDQEVPDAAVEKLRYQNLTALDVDHDGEPEFVGSYWTETATDRRDLLFFIAEKNADGTYALTYKEYTKLTPDNVMSGDVKDTDDGVRHQLLLDVFDYDNEGVSAIFTIDQAFEGNNFYVYKRKGATWEKVFESYNYHCAY